MKRVLIVLIVAFMLLAAPQNTANPEGIYEDNVKAQKQSATPSADPGILIETSPYIVLEMAGGDITQSGIDWSQLLNSSGIRSRVLDVSQVLLSPELLDMVPLVLVDASVGSTDGAAVAQEMIDILIRKDISLVLTGRSAWILHRLRDVGPPSLAVPATTILFETADFAGAAFMVTPNVLTIGSSITTETGVNLPKDQVQTEVSRIVDLTGASPANIATLRFESMPLDIFLYSPEDPTKLTSTGKDLLENIIAFSSALRESETSLVLANRQELAGSLLEGGFSYQHEPTIAATYYAVHSARSLRSGSEWSIWVSENAALVQSVLETLVVDFGSETGFLTSETESVVHCMSTAQGLWLTSIMDLTAQFNVPEIVAFLSTRQETEGGFENDITTTYHVTEALYVSTNLGSIDTIELENWLRSLVIDGGKTTNPDLWGAIGSNPTSLSPTNDYAVKYLRSLSFIGKAHPDPDKLTNWIISRTSNGDGSFRNSLNPDEEIVTGTASALSSMQVLGTLSTSNKTQALSWFSANQLDSGGFGLKPKTSDLVGKTRETSRVSLALNLLSETGGVLANGILGFLSSIRTDVGFEGMDLIPSLMWTSWILSSNRLSHSSASIDLDAAEDYLSNYVKWTQYPIWENITTLVAPEYLVSQYRTKSVWVQYFGALATKSLGLSFSSDVISEATLYLSQAQYFTGHYRPTSLMGTAHVQHSVAAVETLYLLDEIDTIPYRASLESAMLSEYSSGSWDSTGWTLEPFAGNQEAIDFLSTRAAIRLGIVTPTMASEIAATVLSRIQYTDLLALSYSVATLSLLNTSAFSVDLESIDCSQVLSALRSSSFAAGWYNSSFLRQPIYTESVLKMVSILGLRPSFPDIFGCVLSISTNPTVSLNSNLEISVSITSPLNLHSVLVNVFGNWTLFENVANSDTVSVPIPQSVDVLGPANVFVMVVDWGSSRAFDNGGVIVEGSILGSLNLETPTIKIGEAINGSLDWSLNGGIDAGESQIVIRLGNPPTYTEWTYDEDAPFLFSIPSTGFDTGTYNLTVRVEKQFCQDWVLQEEVTISEPNPTYISAQSSMDGIVDEALTIDWSLHFQSNLSQIEGQIVSFTVIDVYDVVIFSDIEVSEIGGNAFVWTPPNRGEYNFSIQFLGNQSLEGSQFSGAISVFETPIILISSPSDFIAPTSQEFQITVLDNSLTPLEGVTVHCVLTVNSSTIYDGYQTTLIDGAISLFVDIDNPGQLIVLISISPQGWLLETSASESYVVFASTSISISIPGQPIEEGSIIGVVITLLDWKGSPLGDSQVTITITWSNGTIFQFRSDTTNEFGLCTLAQAFSEVGDFIINATYFGYGLNKSASDSISQRVFVTPSILLTHDPSCIVGDTLEIKVGLTDSFGEYIAGRTISITIVQGGLTVFDAQVQSTKDLTVVNWDPSQGGLATINVLHVGDIHYLANSTTSTTSILEHVSANLWLNPSQVDLFDSTTIAYNITSGLRVGITIHFEVLGMDLVPVWSQDVITNASGIAAITYDAIHSHGVLRVNARPTADEFLIGGDKQELLIVMTDCIVETNFLPSPPTVDSLINITIQIADELGALINGLTITVSLFDPYSEQVKLGYFTMSISVTVNDGFATVEFTPEMVGLYSLVISSSGATSIHSFTQTDYHTVYSGSILETSVSTHELEVGDTLEVVALLTDHDGNPLIGRNLTLIVDGPGANLIGPLDLVTDTTGHIVWTSALDDEGLWILEISFTGLGVYLPVATTDDINVRFGTVVELNLIGSGDVVAGIAPASFSVLLCDSGGTPLEGFTIHYEAYHDTLGLVIEGNIIQLGTEPLTLDLAFDTMGNYTIIASFAGTSHYHESNAAIQLWVLGTTEVSIEIPSSLDRSSETSIPVHIIDENGLTILLSELDITLNLLGPNGPLNLTEYFSWSATQIEFVSVGLPTGSYSLNITIESSETRVGCVSLSLFSITSTTELVISQESLAGLVSERHSFVVDLKDSLEDLIEDVSVWVSIYNPTGREIFGSPLSDRSAILSGSEVSWMPTLVGEYRIFLEFEGDFYHNGTSLEMFVQIRYLSSLTLQMPELMEYGDVIPVTVTLKGALGTISSATITLSVITDGLVIRVEPLTSNNQGVASFNLVGLLSGTHTIRVSFDGSITQASCETELEIVITPLVVLSIKPISTMYVGHYCSVNLSVSVLGTSPGWIGTLDAWLFDPDQKQVTERSFQVGIHSIITIGFNAQKLGTHSLNVTLSGLPVLVSQTYPMAVVVVDESLQLELDAGTTPLLGGFGVLAIMGMFLRKKMRGVVDSLPSEWSE